MLSRSFPASLMLVAALLMVGGCAKDIRSGAYSEQQVGETADTYEGVIVSAREVLVTEGDSAGGGPGTLLGAAAGGIGGSQFGDGAGAVAATAGGAILGGLLGAAAETQMKKQLGIEYIVRLKDGSMKTVVQGKEQLFTVGQKVFLLVSQGGRSRLIPNSSK